MKKTMLCAALLCAAGLAQAAAVSGFTDAFAVANWQLDLHGGAIDLSGAPDAVTLISSDAGSVDANLQLSSRQAMSITLTQSGQLSFHWAYDTLDNGPAMDPFGYLLNGVFHQLSIDDSPTLAHQGDASLALQLGDVFGFAADSFDSAWGQASTVVSALRFDAPDAQPLPEPGALLLSLLALGLVGAQRRRQANAGTAAA